MIDLNIKKLAEDIKSIKIQGASNIEQESIKGIEKYILKTNKNGQDFLNELTENIQELISQRPNEPKLRNSMNYILKKANEYKYELDKTKLLQDIKNYHEQIQKNNAKISELASKLITNGSKILTHCHSTLVENAFKKAKDAGIDFEVFCTETRPLFQGRITAKNLCEYGIKTTMLIDSEITHILKSVDFFFTGADVVFSDGSIMNKVGTTAISMCAQKYNTPHIVLTPTHCCETNELLNINQQIEERDPNEIWEKENRPPTLNIKNPAFDIVPNELIDKFITEEGVFSPETLYLWVNKYKLGKEKT